MNQQLSSGARIGRRVGLVAIGVALLPAIGWAQAGPVAPDRLVLSVDDYRPLSVIATELQKRYAVAITYEEGPWAAADDLEDVTESFILSNGPGKAAPPKPVIGPRRAAVSFEYALDPAKRRPTDWEDLLAALLFQYDLADGPGRFRLEAGRDVFHLIPEQLKDAAGKWQPVAPVLSTPVHLEDAERSAEETIAEVVRQVNEASPVEVRWVWAPTNVFRQTTVRLAADGVPAREVMRQVLELLPRRVSWILNYDPTTARYYLSFPLLPGGR